MLPKNVEEEALSQIAAEKKHSKKSSEEESDIDSEEEEENDDPSHSTTASPRPVAGRQRFVNLVGLFPPLPQKGDFEVRTVKDSLYFFS